ncbi:MAG: hypothetical protein KTR35_05365 [Gammaproteobacteria bacterium]|nr:hypothetical protein [Gammaproteobacteria bacterium]
MNRFNRHLMLVMLFSLIGLSLSACGDNEAPEAPEPNIIDVLPNPRGLIPELQQADAAFESAHYSGNLVCAACHTDHNVGDAATMVIQDDSGFRDVSIGRAWETSLMANSTRDPYWHAVFASELHNFPNLSEEINDTCTRCHAPMANDFAKKEGLPLQVFDSGSEETGDLRQGIYSMDASQDLFNHAMDGVSCSMCHQMADDGNLGTDQGMSGGWTVIAYPEENFQDRPAYGQYTDPDQGYMRQQSGYTPVYGPHISSSETCGSCHNLKTEPVDKNGQPVPGVAHFAEQMVYTEWENSIFDDDGLQPTSCQSCHMPKVDQLVPLANAGGDIARPDFAEHTFLGANTVMQDMLKNFKTELGVSSDISEADFDESIERNRQFLKTSAMLELQNSQLANNTLTMDVKITNLTGHKLPSGYHSRRAYLHVLVTDADGKLVYENGKIGPDGSIAGVSEDTSPDSYELHYDKITSATQVQVYQGITGDAAGDQTHSLLAATQFLKDNRLTPAGFDKNTVPEDVAVKGLAATDSDFNNGQDTVTYEIAVTGKPPYSALVELRYQPLAFGSLMSLFAESDEVDQVDMFRTIYDSTTLRDEVIATATTQVQ